MSRTIPSGAYPSVPEDAAAVTANDTTTFESSMLYVGAVGNVKVTTAQGSDVAFTAVPAGTVLPVRVRKVFATGTTASNLVRVF